MHPGPDAAALRALADHLADMARGSRDLATEAEVVAARFRPEFDALRDEKGNFPDQKASNRALEIYRFVIDNERRAKIWSGEADILERSATALRAPGESAEASNDPQRSVLRDLSEEEKAARASALADAQAREIGAERARAGYPFRATGQATRSGGGGDA